jgi:hypothetical protein
VEEDGREARSKSAVRRADEVAAMLKRVGYLSDAPRGRRAWHRPASRSLSRPRYGGTCERSPARPACGDPPYTRDSMTQALSSGYATAVCVMQSVRPCPGRPGRMFERPVQRGLSLTRPLPRPSCDGPRRPLIDEVDRLDVETEALLLSALRLPVSIPELGTITARQCPGLLTSNGSRSCRALLALLLSSTIRWSASGRSCAACRHLGASANQITRIVRKLRVGLT